MKVVLDANQFISAILVPAGHPAQIFKCWRDGEMELFLSLPILGEIRRVLLYPRLQKKHGLSVEQIDDLLANTRSAAHITPGRLVVQAVADDPTDDKYIACALEANANYIVSGDNHLLRLGHYQEIQIVTPAKFLFSILGKAQNE
jgi:uncharacterized protein